jgi:hypothetical protein
MRPENFNSWRDQEVHRQWNTQCRGACWVEVLTHILTNRIFVSIAVNLAAPIRFASITTSLVARIAGLVGFASIAASFSPLLQ